MLNCLMQRKSCLIFSFSCLLKKTLIIAQNNVYSIKCTYYWLHNFIFSNDMLYLHIKHAFNCILSVLYSLIFDINFINMYTYTSSKHSKKKREPVCRPETAVKNGPEVTREPIKIGHTSTQAVLELNFFNHNRTKRHLIQAGQPGQR